MTRAKDCLDQMLKRLHAVEHDLELESALNPDKRLSDAEIALHECIGRFERIAKHPAPGEKWDCSKLGHVDNGGMFLGACKHCGIDTDPL